MEINGKIISVLPTQSGQGRNGEWVKNSFVIEWSDNGYAQKLCLEVVGADKWEKMRGAVVVGNEVSVRFSVTSREWNGKWFTAATCFYCSVIRQQQPQHEQSSPQPSRQQPAVDSGLPF